MGENHFATLPAAAYGVVLLMAAISYRMLQHRIIASQGEDSILKRAIGSDWTYFPYFPHISRGIW
jgi:uncharacterized membrane protein